MHDIDLLNLLLALISKCNRHFTNDEHGPRSAVYLWADPHKSIEVTRIYGWMYVLPRPAYVGAFYYRDKLNVPFKRVDFSVDEKIRDIILNAKSLTDQTQRD